MALLFNYLCDYWRMMSIQLGRTKEPDFKKFSLKALKGWNLAGFHLETW
jgi:hypothetical protein